ncbi:MAG: hypothetical protein D8M58_16770 [Calditrichaeota bacterium]|nr:MAG: hypothetical protein DWQ03_11900 [Calditrichota bacterium]MBL1207060.1 hypothetical protein [Calditrichota bacterium]NOG46890.1 hypothetical protein [Calditrichota bacterium]
MSKSFLILLILSILFSCKNEKVVLAEIDNFVVGKKEFLTRLKDTQKRMNVPDNGQVRKGVLQQIVNEKLMLIEAKRNNFDTDEQGQKELERLTIQNLLDTFTKKEILSKVNISENKIKKAFIQSETKLKARHLYAATKREADSLYNLLQQGVSFNVLSEKIFSDPFLKKRGGDLGYFSYFDMELSFADAAYSLKVGEISKPVKTNNGYSVIYLDDRIVNPLTTETEYLKARSKIAKELLKRENKRAAKEFADSLAKSLQIEINQSVFNMLFEKFKKKTLENQSLEEYFVLLENPNLSKEILANTKSGPITVKEFLSLVQFSSKSQRGWIQNKENFQDFIYGLVTRKHILQSAKQKGFDEGVDFKNSVDWEFNTFLIYRVKSAIKNNIHIPDDSLQSYYTDHSEEFISPNMINLREIVVLEKHEADHILTELKRGKSFQDLAKAYSISKTAVNAGETGFVPVIQLGNFAKQIFSLKPNEWRGPFVKDKSFIFLQCVEKKKSSLMSFADVKLRISETLKNETFNSAVQKKLKEIKSQVKISSYPDKLRNISYN